MKIVIPTAGFGTRLRPQTWSKPKPLVPVAGKPVLGHVLDMFAEVPDLDEAIFIIGYLGEQIKEYVRAEYPDLHSRFVVQDKMLGQSHAIWLARDGLQGPLVMAFVDTIIETDLSVLSRGDYQALAWVKEVPDPRRFGVADVDGDGWVLRLVEKPQDPSNNLAVVGFYYFEQAERLIRAIEQQMEDGQVLAGEFYLADAVNLMLEDGLRMRTIEVDVWEDCGKPGPLLDTNRYLLENGRDNSATAAARSDTVIVPPVFIDDTAEVHESVVGPHVSIGPQAVVERSILRNSILDEGAHVVSSSLSASIVGRGARITGRGTAVNVGDSAEVGSE